MPKIGPAKLKTVVLSTYGSRGDVEPMAALGVQMQALGARVRVCAPPDDEFVALLDRAGVELVPFERPWRSWERPATPGERTRRVAEFIEAQYSTVLAAAAGCDLLVATAMSHFVAQSVAESVGIGSRYAIFGPSVLDGPDAQSWNALFLPSINEHRESIGLAAVDDAREFMFGHLVVAADPLLCDWRGAAELRTPAWILPDLRPLPGELDAFLRAGEPPVYVGFGSMRVGEDAAREAIEAIRAHGRRVLFGRGWAELEFDDCFSVGEVNQQALFGRVAAVIHHGGAGTTTTAARAGAPQVVVPVAGGDQPYWARRVAELGIGATGDAHEALGVALASSERAAAVARSFRADGAALGARALLSSAPA